jgi:putative polyketide hydroxylase
MHEEQAEALVAGGGPAGLAAAIELTDEGIQTLVLERRPGLTRHPRAIALTAAGMQLMWRWGVADEVSRQGFPAAHARSVRATLTAPERQRVPLTEHVWNCPQDRLEEILSVRAMAGGAEIRYGTQLLGLRLEADAVIATAATTDGVAGGIRARYVLGADGARSVARQSCGIGVSQSGQPEHWLSVMFRAPLREHLSDPPFMVYEIGAADGAGAVLSPADEHDRWVLCVPWHPGLGQSLQDFAPARCTELVRAAAGLDSVPVQIQSVQSFQLASVAADQVRAGRVLLAGDAARAAGPVTAPGICQALQDGSTAAQAIVAAIGGSTDSLDEYDEQVRRPAPEVVSRELIAY